jgi:hypothetical protein
VALVKPLYSVTFVENLSSLKVEEKEVKIENVFVIRIHCLDNNKKHNFALYMAPVVRYPMVPTTTMVHRYIPEMKSHC